MFAPTWDVLQRDLNALRAFATTGDALRKLVFAQGAGLELDSLQQSLLDIREGAPTNPQWRVAEHAASIGRLYAVYEHFVEELLSKWLLMRVRDTAFTSLQPDFRKTYEDLFPAMLSRAGEGRYDYLSYETMIADQAKAYSGAKDWRIYPECLIHHERNLRFETLNEIASRSGISDLSAWLDRSWSLENYFGNRRSLKERAEAELKSIVQYRNSAAHAHTSIDETLGIDEFKQYVDFIEAICRALYERVMWLAVEELQAGQKIRLIGRVSEVYSPGTRTVSIVEGVKLSVGSTLILRSANSCARRTIMSLQDAGNSIEEIGVATPKEVGVAFDEAARVNDHLFLLVQSDS